MKTETKGSPIPVRFEQVEDAFLKDASDKTGLPVSELIRRSVRLMDRQRQLFGSFAFLLDLNAKVPTK